MLESFYRTHQYLLSHLSKRLIRRGLMDEIDRNARLVGIKGSRGIGKTTFLLSYAKEFYGIDNRDCLYINLNHLYFTQHSLIEFVEEFRSAGGKMLLFDQVFKYPEWSKELRVCYDRFPDVKIIFSGSAVMRLNEENPDLAGKVAVYILRGFSFREFLLIAYRKSFPTYKLKDIQLYHPSITREMMEATNHKMQTYFREYLHHGFYPFFLERRIFSENLLKTMNMTLEVDVVYIRQIEQRYLPKLRKLLYLITLDAPCAPNVSQLSKKLNISRATIMNYIKYLKDARLVNMTYPLGHNFPKKPSMLYIYNTNLLHAVNQKPIPAIIEYKTFFFNQLLKEHEVNEGENDTDFTIDCKYGFCVRSNLNFKNNPRNYYAVNTDAGEKNVIPLWLFGFLY